MPDRIIKESSCTSDTLASLTDFEERFWWRLTVNCDDFGRCDARPAILKSKLFPLMDKTHKDISKALNRLASVGLVKVYEVDGRPFLQVVKWDKHQRIRAKRSKFPSPDDACEHLMANDSKCPRNPIQSESNPNPNARANTHARADSFINDPVTTEGALSDGSLFTSFWNAYPENARSDREGAWEAWKMLNPTSDMAEKIMGFLDHWKASKRWTDDGGTFIPAPKNFLNPDKSYLRTIPVPAKQTPPKGASGELGAAELEAIQKVLCEETET